MHHARQALSAPEPLLLDALLHLAQQRLDTITLLAQGLFGPASICTVECLLKEWHAQSSVFMARLLELLHEGKD